jgi:hypothetical protein
MEVEKFKSQKSKRQRNGRKTQPGGAGLVSGISLEFVFWRLGFLSSSKTSVQ